MWGKCNIIFINLKSPPLRNTKTLRYSIFLGKFQYFYFPEINGTLELGFQGQNMVMIIYDEHQLNF